MFPMQVSMLRRITAGEIHALDPEAAMEVMVEGVCYDSRQVKPGDLFLPFRGEKTDGHQFIPMALEKADVTLTEDTPQELLPGKVYIRVRSVLEALQLLGGYYRSNYGNPVIGITGSVGKTTTREMTTHVLESALRVFHTEGNHNSQIGVPVTLADLLDQPTDCAVIEMGISEEGGMDRLAHIVKPTIAVVTNIGVAHMEFLKSREGIRTEKLKIISEMDEKGLLFLNGDDPLLYAVKDTLPVKVMTFGLRQDLDIRAEEIRPEKEGMGFILSMEGEKSEVYLSAQGEHNVRNALAALGCAMALGLSRRKAEESLSTFRGSRQRVKHLGDKIIIDDSYNASPDSMRAALSVLASHSGRRVAVLGDMFELGKEEEALHREVGTFLKMQAERKEAPELLITVGSLARVYGEEAGEGIPEKLHIATTEEAGKVVPTLLKSGDTVLFKASNGMHFSSIIKALEEKE